MMIQIEVDLPDELYRRLREIAAAEGRSESDVLVDAARRFAQAIENDRIEQGGGTDPR